ncbi:MAG: hypothetical protein DMG72_10190 [Acidobacteria bacterium]|nr:MAG: hypothetical protein DMG72_10190 [Acidobacteriota bacterium]
MRIVEGPFRAEVYPVRDPKTLTFSYYRYVITRANDEMLFEGLARDKGEAEEAVLFRMEQFLAEEGYVPTNRIYDSLMDTLPSVQSARQQEHAKPLGDTILSSTRHLKGSLSGLLNRTRSG